MPPDDPEGRGLLWINLLGLGIIFTLLALFLLRHGSGLADLLSWLTGNAPHHAPWVP